MNFFKLYMGDYQRDTGALSLAEHGAYLLMLQHYYATEKPLPIGKELYRLLRCESKADRDAVDSVVRNRWIEKDGGLINGRASEEIEKANAYADSQADRANRRWEKQRQMQAHMPTHMPTHVQGQCPTDASHSHSHNQTKPNTKTAPAKARACSLPENFGISDSVRQWAIEKGHHRLEERLEHFVGYARANAKKYADWDQAFMNAVRDDWAKLQPVRIGASSKTASALMSLEGMKNEPTRIQRGDSERPSEVAGFIPAKHAAG